MKVLMYMTVTTLFLVFVLPKLQGYMRMLIEEHDEMEKL
jgi:hypothetical protein